YLFFFQAEDGIRDLTVTGVQTCALPISCCLRTDRPHVSTGRESQVSVQHAVAAALTSGKAGLDQFTDACVRDPKVRALRGKVEVISDDAFSTIAAAVDITTAATAPSTNCRKRRRA